MTWKEFPLNDTDLNKPLQDYMDDGVISVKDTFNSIQDKNETITLTKLEGQDAFGFLKMSQITTILYATQVLQQASNSMFGIQLNELASLCLAVAGTSMLGVAEFSAVIQLVQIATVITGKLKIKEQEKTGKTYDNLYEIVITAGALDVFKKPVKYIVRFGLTVNDINIPELTDQINLILSYLNVLASEWSVKSYTNILGININIKLPPDKIGLNVFEYEELPINQIANIRRKHISIYKDMLDNSKELYTPEPINTNDVVYLENDLIEYLNDLPEDLFLVSSKRIIIDKFEQSKYNVK